MNIFSKSTAIIFITSMLSTPLWASDFECQSGPKSAWLSIDSIQKSLMEDGYKTRKVEVEDGCYEVYVMKDGKKFELFVNPTTGIIEKIKEK
ncbi:MAG: PepSY domain-containing protein [Emcibacter sp.]|nr:PepSY domain-containing protein [Emcibacter sp.]